MKTINFLFFFLFTTLLCNAQNGTPVSTPDIASKQYWIYVLRVGTTPALSKKVLVVDSANMHLMIKNFYLDSADVSSNGGMLLGIDSVNGKVKVSRLSGIHLPWNNIDSKPSIPAAQVNSDWTSGSGVSQILNKPTLKRQETYSGTTNASGNYVITFGTSYSVAPNIQANIIGGSNTNIIKIVSVSTTGVTVNVVNRTDTLGLLPSYSNVNGASVDIVITEK